MFHFQSRMIQMFLRAGEGTNGAGSPRTQELTIQGVTFSAPAPYSDGDTINQAEANALNQTYGENLRNNFADKVKKAKDEAGGTLGEEVITKLRADFATYAAEYEFQGRRQSRTPIDPIGREAQKMARVTIVTALKAKGMKAEELPDGHLERLVKELASKPDYVTEATRRVEAAKALAAGDLDFAPAAAAQ